MVNRLLLTVFVVGIAAGLAGCFGAGGGNQFENTVYDTYRRVSNLDKNLQSSVTQLNQTTATLLTRVDESDQQLQKVQGVLEENRAKLTSLEKKLDSLTNIIYREQGRTLLPSTPSMGAPPAGPPSEVGAGAPLGPAGAAPATAPGTPPGTPVSPAATAPAPGPVAGTAPGTAPGQPPEQPPLEPVAVGPQPNAPAATTPPSTGSADDDYLAAQKSYARQDYQAALDQFGAFLQKYPLSPQAQNAQFWRAKSFQALEKYEDAIAEYNKLRDSYPTAPGDNPANSKVPSAMHQQAVCHARLGQTERAIDLFKQVLRDFPNSPAAVQATEDLQHIK